jgi:hypothetical protein
MRERHPYQKQPAQRIQLRHPPRFGNAQLHRSGPFQKTQNDDHQDKTHRRHLRFIVPIAGNQTPQNKGSIFTNFNENYYGFLTTELLK